MIRKERSATKDEFASSEEDDLTWRLEAEVTELETRSLEMEDFSGRSTTGSAFAVTTQPESRGTRRGSTMDWKTWSESRVLPDTIDFEGKTPTGLAALAVSASVLVETEPRSWRCNWDMVYSIKNDGFPEHEQILRAIEELQCCSWGSLQNIVIRDLNYQPVARVCYKEKSWLSGKLVIAVYAPADMLVGTGEEFYHSGLSCSPRFQLRNSDGEELFIVEYNRTLCSGENHFSIKNNNGNADVAKILGKSSTRIGLRFSTKTSLTLKIILMGFCIGILHKGYQQDFLEGT